MNRRDFIIKTSLTATAAMTLPSCLTSSEIETLGIQLYTLRDSVASNTKDVLKQVAACGYKNIEAYGYSEGTIFGMPYHDFCSYAKDLGMRVVSGHYGFEQTSGDLLKKAIEDAAANGQEYLVVPYLGAEVRPTIDTYKKVCEVFNNAGEECRKAGLRFGYHNHAFEFEKLEGQVPYDVMLSELDPDLVGMELDIYWIVFAGADPMKYFEKYPGRFDQWHVKDMDKTDRSRNADIGAGTIDYPALFNEAKQSGLRYWYMEQESYPGEPIDSVKASAEYLKSVF